MVQGPERQQRPGGAAGLVPLLGVPAAPTRDRGEARLGVHRHGESHALEEREVRRRVGVRDGFTKVEALAGGVVGKHERACLTGGWQA